MFVATLIDQNWVTYQDLADAPERVQLSVAVVSDRYDQDDSRAIVYAVVAEDMIPGHDGVSEGDGLQYRWEQAQWVAACLNAATVAEPG